MPAGDPLHTEAFVKIKACLDFGKDAPLLKRHHETLDLCADAAEAAILEYLPEVIQAQHVWLVGSYLLKACALLDGEDGDLDEARHALATAGVNAVNGDVPESWSAISAVHKYFQGRGYSTGRA